MHAMIFITGIYKHNDLGDMISLGDKLNHFHRIVKHSLN